MSGAGMQWRACPRFPDYEVSDCGDLRRRNDAAINQPGRRLNGIINADGYICYSIHRYDGEKRAIAAHILVAEAFIGAAPSAAHEVAHENGSRLLNTPRNLRWATRQENSDDRIAHGTVPAGVANGRATITDEDVRYIRRRYREIKLERGRVAELDEKFGLCRGQIMAYIPFGHVPLNAVGGTLQKRLAGESAGGLTHALAISRGATQLRVSPHHVGGGQPSDSCRVCHSRACRLGGR